MRGGGRRGENAYTHGQLGVHTGIPPSCNVCVFLATQQERTSHGDTEVEVTRVGRVRLMVAQPCLTVLSQEAQWGGLHLRGRDIGATYTDDPDAVKTQMGGDA